MPRIAAATIAQNRELRRASLIDAATRLIETRGSARLSVADVAAEVGLSRSAVYEYYRSSADLVADVLVDELLTWTEHIAAAVTAAPDPQSKVAAWIRTNLHYAADGRHALVRAAGRIELPPTRRAQIGNLHQGLIAPLREAVMATGQAPIVVPYIWGVTQAAIERIEAGAEPLSEMSAAQRPGLSRLIRSWGLARAAALAHYLGLGRSPLTRHSARRSARDRTPASVVKVQ